MIHPVMAYISTFGEEPSRAALMAILGIGCFVIFVIFGIRAFICYILSGCLKRIPVEHRRQEPNMVWLLLIPLFNLVWAFFVWPKIAESYKSYFYSVGRTDVGDCGAGLAMALCICGACTIIPYVGALPGLAAFVMLIILLVKFVGYKNEIPENVGTIARTPPGAAPTP